MIWLVGWSMAALTAFLTWRDRHDLAKGVRKRLYSWLGIAAILVLLYAAGSGK